MCIAKRGCFAVLLSVVLVGCAGTQAVHHSKPVKKAAPALSAEQRVEDNAAVKAGGTFYRYDPGGSSHFNDQYEGGDPNWSSPE